jgi:ceramide glucosyltransferase
VRYLLLGFAAAAAGYQLVALAAAIVHLLKRETRGTGCPPVSILKPVRGLDPHFREAIRSHALLAYPEYEVLFGVADPEDPAVAEIRRLQAEFPSRRIELIHSTTSAANAKVGVLMDLARRARYPLLLVNDGDIEVPADYLRRLVPPLEDPGVSVVTCLFHGASDHVPGCFEAIGIETNFMPSTLVAPLVGVKEFGLGATLLFRAADLEHIGGFAVLADYLADDYQLARRLTGLGMRAHMARVVVATHLCDDTWVSLWRHQLRWARTIRLCRGGGYLGLPITYAGLWAAAAAWAGFPWVALGLVAARLATALTVGWGVLGSRITPRWFWLAPIWDIGAFFLWSSGLFGRTVLWRGARLRIDGSGRIAS